MNIEDSIQTLNGIGIQKKRRFNSLNIKSIGDLLYHFPRTYENKRLVSDIRTAESGSDIAVLGQISKIEKKSIKRNLHLTKVHLTLENSSCEIAFFNQRHIERLYSKGDIVYCFGNLEHKFGKYTIKAKDIKKFNGEKIEDSIEAVYPLGANLKNSDFRKFVDMVLSDATIEIRDPIPKNILAENNLCDIDYALKNIHTPSNRQSLKEAMYRLIFEEFFIIQSGLLYFKNNQNKATTDRRIVKSKEIEKLMDLLPFSLTNAQKKVVDEIYADFEKNIPMNRLIQGDVGSGKTIVATIFLCEIAFNGYQGAFMAPTEVLAKQHYESLSSLLEPFDINIELMTSSTKKKKKNEILESLENGNIDIMIGTHSLLEDNVVFKDLALVITDEQHRFGVRQRDKMLSKGENPHLLVMSATPIPRTLSLILHGDLNVSIIDELPPGRKPIKTAYMGIKQRSLAYEKALLEIKKGRQIYIVCPLVEASESIEALSATDLYDSLIRDVNYSDISIGLVHGKMKSDEKEDTMNKFKNGEIDILVATTVIEVGINVPNASVMIIENAERFGLSQLHQLRGRVGRGEYESFCILVNGSSSDVSIQRLKIMESSNDGFFISQKDLELRGPGEFFGIRQHGIPELKLADMFRHMKILKKAQLSCANLFEKDPTLSLEDNQNLKHSILQKYKNTLNCISLN